METPYDLRRRSPHPCVGLPTQSSIGRGKDAQGPSIDSLSSPGRHRSRSAPLNGLNGLGSCPRRPGNPGAREVPVPDRGNVSDAIGP